MDSAQTIAFRRILTSAMKQEASDLHLVAGSRPMIRVSGSLVPLEDEEVVTQQNIEAVADALMTAERKESLTAKRDTIFTVVHEDKIRMKVHAFFEGKKLSLSLRLLSTVPRPLNELGVPASFERFTALKEGLVIIGGRQDSGRTTLAASLLDHINRTRVCHIVTLEDPIEYQILSNKSMISQREIGVDVPSFEDGLSSALKEDVDVLYVSDASKESVLRGVLDCANVGQLVFIIMNTDSAVRALERIQAYFTGDEELHIRGLLSSVLSGVIIQQLVPKIGGGVVSVHEILLNTSSMKTIIASNRLAQVDQTIRSSRSEGMVSIDHELAALVRLNRITLDVAKEYAYDQETLLALVRT